MKLIATLSLVVCLGSGARAQAPVPRHASEFTMTLPSGPTSLLANSRGKVTVVQFLYTTCSHCQATAQMLSRLQSEFGSQGLEVVGVAFNNEAQRDTSVTQDFKSTNGLNFPLGTAPLESVLGYLGISVMDRWVVPQIVVIDRNGMIRAQSAATGTAELQDEAYLRSYLGSLLKEARKPVTSPR
jgi:peroxiredoxin